MCGIAGIAESDAGGVDPGQIVRMTDAIAHRGPDGAGWVLAGSGGAPRGHFDRGEMLGMPGARVALGHRRLAIVDVTMAGRQPMADRSGRYWIVFNGEIYNYRELRDELRRLGERFDTGTDTEVLLVAWRRMGHACLPRLNGMFAFAVWDDRERTLDCVRDRVGVKPLFHARTRSGGFAFASEIGALRTLSGVGTEADTAHVHDYLARGYVDHDDGTFFRGISKLPAGCWMRVRDGEPSGPRRWWDVAASAEIDGPATRREEAVERLRELLVDSVRIRLRSDVSVGSCLSGGLDSSTLVALVHREMERGGDGAVAVGPRQKTFTSASDTPGFDERRFAALVASRTHADQHLIFPEREALRSALREYAERQDEPVVSTSQWAQWCVMRRVRAEGVIVTLDGQGADELFGGYDDQRLALGASLLARGRGLEFGKLLVGSARMGPDRRLGARTAAVLAARSAAALIPGSALRASASRLPPSVRRSVGDISTSPFLSSDLVEANRRRIDALVERRRALLAEFGLRLRSHVVDAPLPSLLRYADRNSMAFGVESRMPFLDYRIVEFAMSLPWTWRIRSGWSKWLLRRAASPWLPDEIVWRRDKMPFVTPEARWMRELAPDIRADLRPGTRVHEWLCLPRLDEAIGRLVSGADDDANIVWRAWSLALWCGKNGL